MEITQNNIQELTPYVVGILDDWRLSGKQVINLLGLEGQISNSDLQRMRRGAKSLPFTEEILERIDHIFGITEALRTSYPFSSQIRGFWLRQPHRRFKKQAPLKVMLEEGLSGMVRVRIEVDCAYGWTISEALAERQMNEG